MPRWYVSARSQLGLALLGASIVSIGLYGVGALLNHSTTFAYLIWNLLLAWIPLLVALWLEGTLKRKVWSSWEALLATAIWIGFLPNSFYLISDYVHLQEVQRVDLLYDVVMFSSFVFTGVLLGYLSLAIVHRELLRRLSKRGVTTVVALILLLCSFAIYIGRDLRWNTWDVLAQPASLLFDVSDRFLHPGEHPQALWATLTFFVLLTTFYVVSRSMVRVLQLQKNSD